LIFVVSNSAKQTMAIAQATAPVGPSRPKRDGCWKQQCRTGACDGPGSSSLVRVRAGSLRRNLAQKGNLAQKACELWARTGSTREL
jgi:hypothetical protein